MILYTLPGCPASDKARRALTERGVGFEERRVNENPEWWKEALQYAFHVPVIIWGEGDIEIGWEDEQGWEIA